MRCKISRAQNFWEDEAVEVRNQCLGRLNQVAFLEQCGRTAFKLTVYQVIPSRAYVASIKERDIAPKMACTYSDLVCDDILNINEVEKMA